MNQQVGILRRVGTVEANHSSELSPHTKTEYFAPLAKGARGT